MIAPPLVFNAFQYLILDPAGALLAPLRCFTEPTTGALWLGQQHVATAPTLHELLWRRHAERLQTYKHLELGVYLLPPTGVPNVLRVICVRYSEVRWVPIDLMEGERNQALEWLILTNAETLTCQDILVRDAPPAVTQQLNPIRPRGSAPANSGSAAPTSAPTPAPPPPAPAAAAPPTPEPTPAPPRPAPAPSVSAPTAALLPVGPSPDPKDAARPDKTEGER